MKYWSIYLFLMMLTLSCSKHSDDTTPIIEVPEKPQELNENVISFYSSLSSDKKIQSRSMLADTLTTLTDENGKLYIIAVRYTSKTATAYGADASLLIANDRLMLEQPIIDTVNGGTIYREFEQGYVNNHYYWPENTTTTAGDKVDFYAYFISSATGTGSMNVNADCGTLLVDYTLRGGSVSKQVDLLYDGNPKNVSGLCKKPVVKADTVHLKLKHALAQVRFRIASTTHENIQVKYITIKDVLCSGQFDLRQGKFVSNTNPQTIILYPLKGAYIQPEGVGLENVSKNYIASALIPITWTDKEVTVEVENGKNGESETFIMTICKGGKKLEAGYIYDFTLNYKGKVLEMSEPSINDWSTEDGGSILDD